MDSPGKVAGEGWGKDTDFPEKTPEGRAGKTDTQTGSLRLRPKDRNA